MPARWSISYTVPVVHVSWCAIVKSRRKERKGIEAVKDIENTHNRINTGNLVIDAFVSNHQSIAEQENIEFLRSARERV